MTIAVTGKENTQQPFAILGGGVTGRALVKILESRGVPYELFDQSGLEDARADFNEAVAAQFGNIIYSPGFSLDHPWLKAAKSTPAVVQGELDWALGQYKGEVIAVTGTVGKTSMVHLLGSLLERAGKDFRQVGNIGLPLSAVLESTSENTLAIAEVSSFQAETIRGRQFKGVIWTNFSDNHLDRHLSTEAYFRAKARLLEGSFEFAVAGESVRMEADRIGYPLPSDIHWIEDRCAVSPFDLNFSILRRVADVLQIEESLVEETVRDFRPPPHRYQLYRRCGDWSFWNDSKSTALAAVLAALQASPQPRYWIGGGSSKNENIEEFARAVAPHFEEAFLIGETGAALANALTALARPVHFLRDLGTALASIFQKKRTPGAVIFSPGFASFDQFCHYQHRGEVFQQQVDQLIASAPALTS